MNRNLICLILIFTSALVCKQAFTQPYAPEPSEVYHVDESKFANYKTFYFPAPIQEKKWTQDEMKKIFPWELPPTSSQSKVFSSFADKSLQYWWNNSQIRNTAIGRAADEMQEKMKADVVLQNAEDNKDKVEHKLSFQVLAAQAIAKLEYSGYLRAAFRFHMRDSTSECEISQNIKGNKNLILRQTNTIAESRSSVLMSWDW